MATLSLDSPPLSLLSVCTRWRKVALATPSLWDSIVPPANSIPCIKAWMKVSQDQPFHLLIKSHHKLTQATRHACELFRLLSTVSHRWRSLSIRLDAQLAEELLNFLQANTGNPIPIKDVHISLARSDIPETTMGDILSLLPSSTSMERLYLNWGGGDSISVASRVPWKLLKTIIVKTRATQDVVDILSQCTSASVVKIFMYPTLTDLVYHQTSILYHGPPVLLPLLTSLTLSRWTDPMILIQYFTFPSLHNLWIEVAHRDLFAFGNFLKRTPLLEKLVIDESGKDEEDSPEGPSEQDIIDYLVIPELCNIPSFKLTFRDAHTIIPSMIQYNPDAWILPSLLCWREYCHYLRYKKSSFIGWGKHWFTKDLIWEYRQGKIEFTPGYHSKWYNWRDETLDQPEGTYFRRPLGQNRPFKCIPLVGPFLL